MLVGFACLVTGTPNAILFALVSFIASFIPVVGTAPVTLSLTIWAFSTGTATEGIIFVVTIAAVALVDNLLRPLVMKGGAEMHPLIAFIAAFGGLSTFGFYGLFVGPVVAGLFFAILPIALRSYARPR
jgi:predicted PurR-regulated permease PerM